MSLLCPSPCARPLPHAVPRLVALGGLLLALAGCEQLGIEDPVKAAAAKEAEGKAIGSACRHAMRAIEDCYTLNTKANKSAVFAGWREMDEYMRENKLEGIAPVVPRLPNGKPAPPPEAASAEKGEEDSGGKADSKAEGKSSKGSH